jgi:hypothetical protein
VQAISDEQQIDRLEKKVDRLDEKIDRKVDGLDARIDRKVDGLDARIENVRSEARGDFRTLLGVQLTTLVAMILGFAGLILQHL